MTAILALDATSQACSAAIQLGHKTLMRMSTEERAHSQHLLPFIRDLLTEADVELEQLDAIACGIGPGSFTGLRIAFSFAQGLAYALGIPLFGINSLEALALDSEENPEFLRIPLLDARMNEVYWSIFDKGDSFVEQVSLLGQERTFLSQLEEVIQGRKAIAVGDDWKKIPFASVVAKQLRLNIDDQANISALSILTLGQKAYEEGQFTKLDDVSICYCRDSVAWNKRIPIRPR